jgi:hypothetical protein
MAGESVTIQQAKIDTIMVEIEGVSELIMHKWSDKAKRQILDKQMKRPVKKDEAKDPQADYEATIYRCMDGTPGMPAGAFKTAIIDACRMYKDLAMVRTQAALFVLGEPGQGGEQLVRINGEPRIREDMVRIGRDGTDIRYRAGFPQWSATLKIRYNADMLTAEQLYNLIDTAGLGGVGDWRPSKAKSGTYGMFQVVR